MITYETLRSIDQQERKSAMLAKLPDRFLQEVRAYLEKKEAISEKKEDQWELQSAKQKFQTIMENRERKIVNLTLSFIRSGAVPENMMPEEQELFDGLVRSIRDFQGRREKAMSGERPQVKTLAFLQDLPRFVGIDMGYYGPYKSGDMATVPEENAKLLVEKGAAEVVDLGK